MNGQLSPSAPGETERRRVLLAAGIAMLGLWIAVFHLRHFLDSGFDDIVTLNHQWVHFVAGISPFVLVLIGLSVYHSAVDQKHLRRVAGWTVLGTGAAFVFASLTIQYQSSVGGQIAEQRHFTMTFVAFGSTFSGLGGWYETRLYAKTQTYRGFKKAVEQAGHGVMITERDGTIQYVNPAFEEMSGYASEEVRGQDPSILNSSEHDEEFFHEMWQTILNGDVWQSEIVNEDKDSERYYVDQTIAPLTDGDGRIEGFVAVNNDITELKQYERDLEQQNERLEKVASVISHDLRNPLNAAMTRTDLLAEVCDNSGTDHLDVVQRSLERMEQIIQDVLTLARENKHSLERSDVRLDEVASDAWELVTAAGATLENVAGLRVRADPNQLQQLFENLFRNAVEHGGSDVTVEVGSLPDGFYVADDGTGFDGEVSRDLFEAGYTTSRDGTGLGLSIVEEIAAMHGWTVRATNSENGGARFEITDVETSPAEEKP